ncbi:MAG: winged helix-turn-helix domain-containing protein, partial [Mesorhizobium sp.]
MVGWRRIDLQRVIADRFGVAYHERYVGKLLKELGFSHFDGHDAIIDAACEAWQK